MIVRATQAHAPLLAHIHQACFAGADAWQAADWITLLGTPGTFGLVDEAGGLVLMRGVWDEADVVTVAVQPQARRQGLGGRLLGQALAEVDAAGCLRVFLEVACTNLAAIGLYQQHGFASIGQRLNYYADGGDALLMRRGKG